MQMVVMILQYLVLAIIRVYELLLIARVLISWLPLDASNPIVNFLYTVTEPLMAPVRNLLFRIPALQNLPIDFSPIVVFLVLDLVRMLVL